MPTITSAARRSGLIACSASRTSREATLSACCGRRRQRFGIVERQHDDLAAPLRLAHLVDEEMVHDREQPAPRALAGAPVVDARQRPLEAILHEIVGRVAVAQQRARIAPQPGNFRKDRRLSFFHAGRLQRHHRAD